MAAESAYANVAGQIGGRAVDVTAIMDNPNTDPHAFQASPLVARELATADLVVINGLGYDAWAQKLLAAPANRSRRILDVQTLLGLPKGTPNPHIWYRPTTMPAVARAVADDLTALRPVDAAYFQANLARFQEALRPWSAALAALKLHYAGTAVAVTEPVADDLLEAAGLRIATPFSFQAAIMNGTDPSPQDVAEQERLLRAHQVRAFVYNVQVTDPLTQSLLRLARHDGVPVVGVYETLPAGYTYQSWMLAETQALEGALADGRSTSRL